MASYLTNALNTIMGNTPASDAEHAQKSPAPHAAASPEQTNSTSTLDLATKTGDLSLNDNKSHTSAPGGGTELTGSRPKVTTAGSDYIQASQPGGASDPALESTKTVETDEDRVPDKPTPTASLISEAVGKHQIPVRKASHPTRSEGTGVVDPIPTSASPTAALIEKAIKEDKIGVTPGVDPASLQSQVPVQTEERSLPEKPSPTANLIHSAVDQHTIPVAPAVSEGGGIQSIHEPTPTTPATKLGGAAHERIPERIVASDSAPKDIHSSTSSHGETSSATEEKKKVSLGNKIGGATEKLVGKMTKNEDKIASGEARRTGGGVPPA